MYIDRLQIHCDLDQNNAATEYNELIYYYFCSNRCNCLCCVTNELNICVGCPAWSGHRLLCDLILCILGMEVCESSIMEPGASGSSTIEPGLKRLSFAYQSLREIPYDVILKQRDTLEVLDLSYNLLDEYPLLCSSFMCINN